MPHEFLLNLNPVGSVALNEPHIDGVRTRRLTNAVLHFLFTDGGLIVHANIISKTLLFRLKIRIVGGGVERPRNTKTAIASTLTGKGNIVYY